MDGEAAVGPKIIAATGFKQVQLGPCGNHISQWLDGAGDVEDIFEQFFDLQLPINGLLKEAQAFPVLPVGRPGLGE
jgi:hypothetical protein